MTNEKILDRINKLLAKTVENGCTPEEAAAAAAKAQQLIAKHHINLREQEEEHEEAIGATLEPISRTWQGQLAHCLATNMCCEVILNSNGRKKTLVFMGKETDLEAVMALYDKFTAIIKEGIKAQKKTNAGANVETSYAMGFISSVREAMQEQCRALTLVVPEEVNEAVREQFPHLGRARTRSVSINGTAYGAGRVDGRQAAGRKAIS